MIQSRPARTSPKASRKPKPGRSRQEVRTAATQRRLLAAAETVFARDGFEAARLEDIAAIAGYTRGAFYAHFQSKEDIFVGLLEQWVAERIAEVSALLEKQKSPQARLRALRDHYTHSRKDRRLVLLSLEFKLFAIRHPEAHARLRARHQRLRACAGDFVARVAKALGLGALSNALVLEHLFDQAAITDHDIRHILGALFDAILGTATHQQ